MSKIQKVYYKQLVVGDIHGQVDIFKQIYEKEKPTNDVLYDVVILGDYLDTHEDISVEDQVNGLKELFEVQKNHLENAGSFDMLIGNHDFHYLLDGGTEQYSGYNIKTAMMTNSILKEAVNKHRLSFSHIDIQNRIIYTHAGVTNTWINYVQSVPIPINMIDLASYDSFKFKYGKHMDPYGDDVINGPLWVRPNALLSDMYKDFDNDVHKETTWTQVVGHTSCVKPIIAHEDGSKWHEDENWRFAKFYDIDCLSKGYYIIESFDEGHNIINREIKNLYQDSK